MFEQYLKVIKQELPEKSIITSHLQRFAYGTDASFYRLVPKVVLRLDNEQQLVFVIQQAQRFNIAITFRAAGTSLSGQAITDSVLIILSPKWNNIEISNNGEQISLQPGVIGAAANKALQAYQRKIGPDPASINSCKIGGIAANNASGMCCGVKDNSYHTLAAIKLVFADGCVLDTQSAASVKAFRQEQHLLIEGIEKLAFEVKNNADLAKKIAHKYRLKNTTGYGINALIEFDDAIDIISHLMIGSEGTLAFIADITYNTVKIAPFKATGLYVFDDMAIACQLVNFLASEETQAVEIMDSRALSCVDDQLNSLLIVSDSQASSHIPSKNFPNNSAGLLIEFAADSAEALTALQHRINAHIDAFANHLLACKAFTSDAADSEALWKIRKGMFPAVGAVRETGTTVVIEDIALPLAVMAKGIDDLHQLFSQFGYSEAIIFGHALAGNLHFVFTQAFDTEEKIKRYHDFMTAVSHMVAVEYQGSLKAEHGTGRNMAPFVELEWGSELYQVMRQIKQLFDPQGILNPGVILNDDKNAHITHLKTLPAADPLIDKCIECGFCESVCPSQHFTLTPRQRIALWRRMQQLAKKEQEQQLTAEQNIEYRALKKDYQFFGIDSCAATGLCGQECPVKIDTGQFIKTLRKVNNSKINISVGKLVANNFSAVSLAAKTGLKALNVGKKLLGETVIDKSFLLANKVSNNAVPLWYPAWPSGATKGIVSADSVDSNKSAEEKVIYIPACGNRIFSADPKAKDQRPLVDVLHSIFSKAGISLVIPNHINDLCCGMPWQSKGLPDIAEQKRSAFIDKAFVASEQGKWPVITDASPCALTLSTDGIDASEDPKIVIFEATEFIVKQVLSRLNITKSQETVMLHKTCSSQKMDGGQYLTALAKHCVENIIEPVDIHCCGFAGDKGFYLPELNESALSTLKPQVPVGCSRGISNSRTCEIGLSKNSGISYQSILYLLDEVSLPC